MNDQVSIECGPHSEKTGKRLAIVFVDGKEVHRDRLDTDQSWQRQKFREAAIPKIIKHVDISHLYSPEGNGNDDYGLHNLLESQLIAASDVADESGCGIWEPIVTTLGDVSSATPQYLWAKRIPLGMLSCADGDGGTGKGLSLMDIAARGSRGAGMPPLNTPDGTIEPWSTLFITSEDSPEYVLRPRAEAAGANLDRIATLSTVEIPGSDRRSVKLNVDIPIVERIVTERGVKLVVIDPWSEFLGDGLSINSDQDNRAVLGPLAEMAQRTGSAVVIVRHLSKKEGVAAQYRGVGSTAPLNASRGAFVVAPDPDDNDRRVWACTKFNIGIKPPSISFRIETVGDSARVVWEGETELTASELMRSNHKPSGGKLERAKSIITEILADGPRGSSEVLGALEAEEISKRTYHTARKSLGIISQKSGFDDGQWMLTLPGTNGATL